MIRVIRSAAYPAPADQVWQTLCSLGDLALWHPAVQSSRSVDAPRARVGAIRHVATRDGLSMEEELIAFAERDRRLELLTRTAPVPLSLMWQALTVFGVTATDGAVLRWELRADGAPDWTDRIRVWFGDGYIPAGLHGLAAHLSVRHDKPIN